MDMMENNIPSVSNNIYYSTIYILWYDYDNIMMCEDLSQSGPKKYSKCLN